MEFVRNIGDTVLSFTASNVCCSSRELSEMFSGRMRRHLEKVSRDALRAWAQEGLMFGGVVLMVYDRVFECDIERWRWVVCAESIVCEASVSMHSKLLPEEVLGILAERFVRRCVKEGGGEGPGNTRGYADCGVIDVRLFVDAYVKHGSEVISEIVKQMMMGKDGKEIDSEYVEKVVRVVDGRKRSRVVSC
ncbi:putative immunoglobulin G-binding protein A [Encephalitozoon hellem]|uniref:Immunoglobulin G-binding protein A n=1 Tax=Encephalitozoon hellem TaxID=27973 RepID=A0ABY8CMF6_ENCHE|nr:putative immunoglobulin G-binding protein A [Encephalitozoon hellem]WEL38542.1 putative immunoglobulin G-binding protein A [Encephalitozoon hellem]WEL38743.1 putative immunoglobulin G-binding protein A [Encephalitozoon hellem]WEL39384.1 putative immunoglobulin G-binding protein A [Encephalitozoon hellem]